MTEKFRGSNHLLETAFSTINAPKLEAERLSEANRFASKANELLWDYGPVKIKNYSLSYKYPYREPGTGQTPPVSMDSPEGNVTLHIEGEFAKDTRPYQHPDDVILKQLSLCLTKGNTTSRLSVNYNEKGILDENTLPSNNELQKASDVVDYIRKDYEIRRVKRSPQGYADPDPCS